jgi:hypothetical protein
VTAINRIRVEFVAKINVDEGKKKCPYYSRFRNKVLSIWII